MGAESSSELLPSQGFRCGTLGDKTRRRESSATRRPAEVRQGLTGGGWSGNFELGSQPCYMLPDYQPRSAYQGRLAGTRGRAYHVG